MYIPPPLCFSYPLAGERTGERTGGRASGGGSQHSVYVGYQKGKGKKLNPSCAKVILSYRDGSHRTANVKYSTHTNTHSAHCSELSVPTTNSLLLISPVLSVISDGQTGRQLGRQKGALALPNDRSGALACSIHHQQCSSIQVGLVPTFYCI